MTSRAAGKEKRNVKRVIRTLIATTLACVIAGPARAADGCRFVPFGDAEVLADGSVRITSDYANGSGFGGVDLVLEEDLTVGQIEELGTGFDFEEDTAGAGSPRFGIAVDEDGDGDYDGSIFIYLGDPPNYNTGGAGDTGNLVDPTDLVDASQLIPGGFYTPWEVVVQELGDADVLGVFVVVDAGYIAADLEQSVVLSNIRLNDCTFAADSDDDGVIDDEDHCPNSDQRPKVDVNGNAPGVTSIDNVLVEHGCTIQDLVNECAAHAKNHGQYVSCIAHLANDLRKAGIITNKQSSEMKSSAAQSSVGK